MPRPIFSTPVRLRGKHPIYVRWKIVKHRPTAVSYTHLDVYKRQTRDKLAINKVGQFGRALQKLNIPCRKSRKGTLYHLMKVE